MKINILLEMTLLWLLETGLLMTVGIAIGFLFQFFILPPQVSVAPIVYTILVVIGVVLLESRRSLLSKFPDLCNASLIPK